MTDIAPVLERLRKRYGPKPRPVCRLCGHSMTIGTAKCHVEWVCDGPEADFLASELHSEEYEKRMEHYSASRIIQTEFEDRDVMDLIELAEVTLAK